METNTQGQLPLNEAKTQFSLFHKIRKMGKKNIMTGLLIFMGLWLVGACLFTVMANGTNRAVIIDREIQTLTGEKLLLDQQVIDQKVAYDQADILREKAFNEYNQAMNAMSDASQGADAIRATIAEKEQAINVLVREKAELSLGFKKPQ